MTDTIPSLSSLTHDQVLQTLLAGGSVRTSAGSDLAFDEPTRRVLHFYTHHEKWRKCWEDGEAKNASDLEIRALIEAIKTAPTWPEAPGLTTDDGAAHWDLVGADINQFGGLHAHCSSTGSPPDVIRLDFARPIQLFQGRNGAGKSQIIRALAWAMTGRIPRSQGEPAALQGMIAHYNAPPTAGGTQERAFDLPVIVPFPDEAELEACGGTPRIDTAVTLRFHCRKTDETRHIRRWVKQTARGFEHPVETIDPATDKGKGTAAASVADALGIPPLALETAALTLLHLPFLRLEDSNPLTQGVATVTGLRPLQVLGERIGDKIIGTWLSKNIPAAARKQQTDIQEAFSREVERIAAQFTAHAPIAPALLPAPPQEADGGKACVDVLAALEKEILERERIVVRSIEESTGLTLAGDDVTALTAKVDHARKALTPDAVRGLPEYRSVQKGLGIDSSVISRVDAALDAARTSAAAFVALDTDRKTAARRRLYSAIDRWRKSNASEDSWPPDGCPVCARPLDGEEDGILGRPIRTALEEAAHDEEALHLDALDWERQTLARLNETWPLTVPPMSDRPSTRLRRFFTTDVVAKANLTDALKPLADTLVASFEELAASFPPDTPIGRRNLPQRLDTGTVVTRMSVMLHWNADARWWLQAGEAVDRVIDGLFGTDGVITRRLDARLAALHTYDPVRTAKEGIAALKAKKQKWDEQQALIADAAATVEAARPLMRLAELVPQEVAALMERLDTDTAKWTDAFYAPGGGPSPALRGSRVEGESLHILTERGTVRANGREIVNASRLRTHLFAFTLAFLAHLRQGGGVSLLLLDDPQSLVDEHNQRRLAAGLGGLPEAGFRPIVTTFDQHFAGSLFRQVDNTDAIDFRQITARSTGRPRACIEQHADRLKRVYDEWKADDANLQRIRAFCGEARIVLERDFRDLVWPGPLALTGGESLEDLRGRLNALIGRGAPYDAPVFRRLANHPALDDTDFRTATNWSHHHAEENLQPVHALCVRKRMGELQGLIDECHRRLDRELEKGPLRLSPTIIPFPEHSCPARQLPVIGAAAARDHAAVDADAAVPPEEGVVGLEPGRHAVASIGTTLDWLPMLLNAGDLLILDRRTRPAAGRLAVGWNGETGRPSVGWYQKTGGDGFVLHGDPGTSHVKSGQAPAWECYAVAGILFGRGVPGLAPPLTFQDADGDLFHGIDGSVDVLAGRSAVPLAWPGDHALVGPPLPIEGAGPPPGSIVAVELDDGTGEITREIKRLGRRLDPEGRVRMLESLGPEGEARPVRLSGDAQGLALPRVKELRRVLGFWFTATPPSARRHR
ncbi:MAG: ATP-binding protein [Alphaproteobacteria bacterium]